MTQDFGSAARRHVDDSGRLLAMGAFDNASHLAGVAAECALKDLMIRYLGGRSTAGKPKTPSNKDAGHLPGVWGLVSALPAHRGYVALAAVLGGPNPFANWGVEGRYSATGEVSQEVADSHVHAAERVYQALVDARISGGPR